MRSEVIHEMRPILKLVMSFLIVVTLAACGAKPQGPVSLEEVEGPLVWGTATSVMRVRHLWFAGQPDEAGLEAAKEAGVTVVLDLRESSEREWDESEVVERLGLGYRNIGIPKQGPFPETSFAEIEAFIKANPDERILLHCSSGNRAAAWFTTHLVQTHGMSFPDALIIGRRTGVTSPVIVEKIAQYVGEEPPSDSAGVAPPPATDSTSRETLRARAAQIFGALPVEASSESNPITEAKLRLGRMLYYESRLSKNHDVSCNSCHALDRFGVDNEPTSPGHRGQRGNRNSPTVYNAALHVAQFWDGCAADVEEQAKGPVLNPVEMALADAQDAVAVLKSIPGYVAFFQNAFLEDSDPVTFDNMARAIGAFERRLVTPSRFDAFVTGDDSALSDTELDGLEAFLDVGCTTCHMGPPVGGLLYQKLGLVHFYETEDTGRHSITGSDADRYFFKVPSLRNVVKTAPYFHDGSIEKLEDAVRLMAWHQLGRELSDADAEAIVTFLGSLTGQVDPGLIARPEMPASGPQTPQPDPS